MSEKNVCGSTDTYSGDPCQNPAGGCPHESHRKNKGGRPVKLEEDPSIADVVAGCLQNGDTVPEACGEARISKSSYKRYRRKGKRHDEEGVDSVFRTFWAETTRARNIGAKNDRSNLKAQCEKTGDTKTLYRIHHDQYGDTYDEEGGDGTDVSGIPLVVPENAMPNG